MRGLLARDIRAINRFDWDIFVEDNQNKRSLLGENRV